KPHRRRSRKPQMGMLVQIDGSHHDWLEGRGPRLVLLSAVDDATSRILSALFWPAEDFEGYRRLLQDLVTHHGVPLAIYSDRHSLFFSPKESDSTNLEQQLLGQVRPLTQIGRILNELGIEHIPARSPQAKGRIERSYLTLQERLTVELRLAGASTCEEANAVLQRFIERYNQKFAVPPADSESAFRPIPSHLRLDHIFCWKEYRTLNPGYTLQYKGETYRVVPAKNAPAIPLRSVVEVHHLAEGNLSVAWRGHIYDLEPIAAGSTKAMKTNTAPPAQRPPIEKADAKPPRRPAPDHPWRKPWASCRVYSATSRGESYNTGQ
ncbi:ISNCY family transposase, partial [Thermoanaerobacterium sp. DL9XJH110]|uniref:ISNCY family transposase n=1 Tax=Thermoanaerobacterium sp. DL9XJH110 TaxID=3386643 RepID=UPI003BB5061E